MAKLKLAPPGIPANLIAEEIDELGALERALAPHQLAMKRAEVLRKTIRAHFDDSPALKTFEARGASFAVLIGAKAEQRTINISMLLRAIGAKAFAAFASCTLSALERNVDAAIASAVVVTEPTGSRSLRVFELPASEPAVIQKKAA